MTGAVVVVVEDEVVVVDVVGVVGVLLQLCKNAKKI